MERNGAVSRQCSRNDLREARKGSIWTRLAALTLAVGLLDAFHIWFYFFFQSSRFPAIVPPTPIIFIVYVLWVLAQLFTIFPKTTTNSSTMQRDDDIIIHYDPHASWTFSYSSTVPNVHSGPVLGPLRRRECQTRQQQLRKGTVRRIGIASKPEDRFQARAIAGNSFQANSINNSNASSGNPSPNVEGRHHGASGLPPRPASEIYQTSSSTFSPNIMGVEPSSSSWTSIPSSPPRKMTSPNLLDVSSTLSSAPYDLPARTRSRIESASQRLAQGSTKSFMMVSQAMGFGSNTSASCSQSFLTPPIASATNGDDSSLTTSTSATFTPINSHLSVAQLGGGGRRMSTPSISSPKLSYEFADPSSYAASGSSLQRPASSLSQTSSSTRSWASDTSSTLASSEANGYYNIAPTSSRKAKRQGACRMSYDPHNSTDIVSDRVPMIISEREYSVEGFDKVFAATWLSPDNVLMGTKCHNVSFLFCFVFGAFI